MAFSIDMLRDEDGRAACDLALAAAVGRGRSDEAEALLVPLLASARTYVSDLCLTLPPAAVSIVGWDAFNGHVARLSEPEPLTAIGIDISAGGEASNEAGRREQRLTCVYYDASCGFDFAAAGPEDIAASLSDGRAASWAGQFFDSDQTLSTLGLATLLDALRRHPLRPWDQLADEEAVRDNLSSWLAERFRHLGVHRALQHALATNGFAAAIPIIVATDAVTPCLAAVYVPEQILRCRDAETAWRETERAAQQAEHDRATEAQVSRWREQRAAIRNWTGDAAQRRTFIEYAEFDEHATRVGTPLASLAPGHSLDDGAFEEMIETWRRYRDPTGSPASPALDQPRSPSPCRSSLATAAHPRPPNPASRVGVPFAASRGVAEFGRRLG